MTYDELEAAASTRPLSMAELQQLALLQEEAYQQRIALDRQSKKIHKTESAAEQLLMDQLRKQKIKKVETKTLLVELNPAKDKPHVTDWASFYLYITSEDDFSLLERRPSASAIQERWDNGLIVPGVEKFPVYSLSKTRA